MNEPHIVAVMFATVKSIKLHLMFGHGLLYREGCGWYVSVSSFRWSSSCSLSCKRRPWLINSSRCSVMGWMIESSRQHSLESATKVHLATLLDASMSMTALGSVCPCDLRIVRAYRRQRGSCWWEWCRFPEFHSKVTGGIGMQPGVSLNSGPV